MPRIRVPTDQTAQDLIDVLAAAAANLRRRLRRDILLGRIGTARYRAQQLAVVNRELASLRAVARLGAQEAIGRAYAAGALGGNAGATDPRLAFTGVHIDAVQALADAMADRLDNSVVQVGRSVADAYRQAGLRSVAEGVAGGESLPETAAALQRRLVREGLTGFVDRAGRRWQMDVYTSMVVRTNTRQAMTQGTVARMIELGQDLITISDHNTRTPLCQHFEGKTYSLTGRTPGYEKVIMLPPFHPNCEHVATPAAANIDAFEALLDMAMA